MLVVGSVIVSTFVICPVATTSGEGRYWRLLDVIVNIGIQVVEMIFELGRCQKSLKLLVELEQQHLGFHFFDPGSFLGEFFLFFFWTSCLWRGAWKWWDGIILFFLSDVSVFVKGVDLQMMIDHCSLLTKVLWGSGLSYTTGTWPFSFSLAWPVRAELYP